MEKHIVDTEKLPEFFPTHRHSEQFWESLGRTIATFGFLEEVLGKAIFALTATRQYQSVEDAYDAYEKWLPQLEKALTDTLYHLVERYKASFCAHSVSADLEISQLESEIKKAADLRNVLCHGSWGVPDTMGKSLPLFVNKQKEVFMTPIDIEFLHLVQRHTAELACVVINSVTSKGLQFPGSGGPGKPIKF